MIFELTKKNTVRKWRQSNFNEVPDWKQKLLFSVQDWENHECNAIYDISFPESASEFEFHPYTQGADFFKMKETLKISDSTGELKSIQIENIWKLLNVGSWNKYQAEKKEINIA